MVRYPIKDVLGRKSLPTCPYEWPNGQGDVGKFLQGIENSGKWESQHGSLYRIWSGMSGDVYVLVACNPRYDSDLLIREIM